MDLDFDNIPDATVEEVVEEEVFNAPPPPVPYEEPVFEMPDPDPIEEDALTIFNREWAKKLEAKREEEFQHEKATREKAQEELAAWRHQKEVRHNAKKEKNRNEEAVTIETLASEASALKTWDRVPKLIDNTEALPAENAKGSDVSRMRKLFIQLKNEPLESTRAAAAVATN